MKVDFDYDVVYHKNDDTYSKHIHVKGVDLFSAQYYAIVLAERADIVSVLIERYTCSDHERKFDCVVIPGKADRKSVMCTLLGGNLLNNRYESLIHDELSAKILAAGIELGIMRSVAFIQMSACNRDDDALSSELDDLAQDVLIYAPSYHAQWKSIAALHSEMSKLQKKLDDIQRKGIEAKTEYHNRLGKTPSFGIMDLPKVREFLENL